MARTIHKFTLLVTDEQVVPVKGLVKLLAVQVQHGAPQLWAVVDAAEDAPVTPVRLLTVGTGGPVTADVGKHLGTYQLYGGSFVGHVFVLGAT